MKVSDAITIREARFSDIETLLKFEQELIATERPFDPTLKPHPNHYYDIKQMIDAPSVHLVVGEFNEKLIACGYARIENSKHYLRHDKHAYLGFMYVDPEWRGKNVNQAIVERLKQWAISKGITEMLLEVYCDNIAAIKAYEKAGFRKMLIQMRMGLANL